MGAGVSKTRERVMRLRRRSASCPSLSTLARPATPTAITQTVQEPDIECLACTTSVPADEAAKGLCGYRGCAKHAYCKSCIRGYVEGVVGGSFAGACRAMKCPTCPRVLPLQKWRPLVPEAVYEMREAQAFLLLSLQCGQCHGRHSLMHDPDDDERRQAEEVVRQVLSAHRLRAHAYKRQLRSFLCGEVPAKALLDELVRICPAILKPSVDLSVEGAAEAEPATPDFMSAVLKTIEDPERRAVLHLRYLHVRPEVWSKCCKRRHCFRCRIKDFHDGYTCNEFMAMQVADEVVPCPSCGLQLVKGDGCNSITCLCGESFNWARIVQDMQMARLSAAFVSRYVEAGDLGLIAARILRARDYSLTPDEVEEARAWAQTNNEALKQGRAKLFEAEHPFLTARQALYVMDNAADRLEPEYALASAWASLHGEAMNAIRIEARRCRALTWRAVHGDAAGTMSLMASERPWVCGMTGSAEANHLDLCFRAFVELHTFEVEAAANAWELHQAAAFEHTFGKRAPLLALRLEDRVRAPAFPTVSEVLLECHTAYMKHRGSKLALTRLHLRRQAARLLSSVMTPPGLSRVTAAAQFFAASTDDEDQYEASLRPQKTLSQILFERRHLLFRPRQTYRIPRAEQGANSSGEPPSSLSKGSASPPREDLRPPSPLARMSGGAMRHTSQHEPSAE